MTLRRPLLSIGLAAVTAMSTPVASAQDFARPVVQPVSDAEYAGAMRRLERSPRDLSLLLEAGGAALASGKASAAVDLYQRARAVAPGDPRVIAGAARAALHVGEPVEALALFAEAESAGAEAGALAAERGLAHALAGEPDQARSAYRLALAREDSEEVQRRLALAQAMLGDRDAFEATLRPLLARRDFPAYRTQAFGLAILGASNEALAIAEAVMPRETAQRFAPFFARMAELTPAQQADAAHFGRFPTSAEIGTDRPGIAAYRARNVVSSTADSRLAPSDEVFGQALAAVAATPDEDPPLSGVRLAASEPAATTIARDRAARREARRARSDPLTRTTRSRPTERARQGPPIADAVEPIAEPATPPAEVSPAALADAPRDSSGELPSIAGSSVAAGPEPDPGADLGEQIAALLPPTDTAPPPTVAAAEPFGAVSVAQAFDGFLSEAAPVRPAPAAVDITSIAPPRERAEPPAPSAAQLHPSRRWVQIAVGRRRQDLTFDWKRLARAAPGTLSGNGPFTAVYGRSHRLLAGPYDSDDTVRRALAALKEAEIEALPFTSDAGEAVEPLR